MDSELIYSYTRAQAIEDGVLMDVSDIARDHGIKYPVAFSSGVQQMIEILDWELERAEQVGRSDIPKWESIEAFRGAVKFNARLLNSKTIINRLRYAIQNATGRADRVDFKVEIHGHSEPLYAVCGPGDDLKPVITVMTPEED